MNGEEVVTTDQFYIDQHNKQLRERIAALPKQLREARSKAVAISNRVTKLRISAKENK